MNLETTLNQLHVSLSHPSNLRVFAAGAKRHPPLARFASPQAVLDVLQKRSSSTVTARDVILVALLAELRRTHGAVWQALLTVAFTPMLVNVRGRLGQPVAVRFGRSRQDDLDQRVLVAFLEAAGSLDISSYAARALHLAVRRRLFGDQKVEREAIQPEEFVDDELLGDPFEVTTRDKAAANEVVRFVEAEGGAELRDMMLATRAHGEPLRGYVARVYGAASLARRRTIERRLATAANRVERRLRDRARRPEHRRLAEPTNPRTTKGESRWSE